MEGFRCPVCGLTFGSDKSLHGHMKLHPDRAWSVMTKQPRTDPNAYVGIPDSVIPEWLKMPGPGSHGNVSVPFPGDFVGELRTGNALPFKENVWNPNPKNGVLERFPGASGEIPVGPHVKDSGALEGSGDNEPNHNTDQDILCAENFTMSEYVEQSDRREMLCNDGFAHRCSTCHKVFQNGRALGGHRRHCRHPESPGGSDGSKKASTIVFGFDLNKLPQ